MINNSTFILVTMAGGVFWVRITSEEKEKKQFS